MVVLHPEDIFNQMRNVTDCRPSKTQGGKMRGKEEVAFHLVLPRSPKEALPPPRHHSGTVHIHHSIKHREIYSIVAKLSV